MSIFMSKNGNSYIIFVVPEPPREPELFII
jgi:hypothetical protein